MPAYSRRLHPTRRPYAFPGLLFRGYCERRMQGNWNNRQAYYRCRLPAQYAIVNRGDGRAGDRPERGGPDRPAQAAVEV
ncbi:hypothetical protein GCM10010176_026320 [Nonomuraea spiralis]|nr:hypothetical protein GCM10010176_026320 [Nonomuraea spiralis]